MNPIRIDVVPHRLSGTVVGALLNDPAELAALGDAVNQPPYKAPPKAPVLAVRPRNTWAAPGAAVAVPASGVTVGVTLGIVIGRTACRVDAARALDHVSAYLVAGKRTCVIHDEPPPTSPPGSAAGTANSKEEGVSGRAQ